MIDHVFANRSNAGDWLSARAIQGLLAPRVVTEHLCDEPFVAGTLAALASASERDLVVIGGGGLLHSYFDPFWRGLVALLDRRPLRFCLWGVGLCDDKGEPTRPPPGLLAAIARASLLTVVRDEPTRLALGGELLPPPLPCPSLLALPAATGQGHGILHAASYDGVGPAAYQAMTAAASAFAAATGRPYRETSNRLEAGDERALAQVLALYTASDLVLSARLHGCIFAAGLELPLLAVSADWKIEAFLHLAGLSARTLDPADLPRLGARLSALPPGPLATGLRERARRGHAAVASRVRELDLD